MNLYQSENEETREVFFSDTGQSYKETKYMDQTINDLPF